MTSAALVAMLWVVSAVPEQSAPLLLRSPTVSRTQVVFVYADSLWTVGREGGEARRLTNGGHERAPYFSPDGQWVAFTGEYDGNVDVYVVPATGGVPRRLTFHPATDEAAGWTPDGAQVLFRSRRATQTGEPRLFTVPLSGGVPAPVPLHRAREGSFSSDATRLAYVPFAQGQRAWKRYRGGTTRRVNVVRLTDSSVEATIPRDNSNDFNPMWVGDVVYFLSDRAGPVTLFAYDVKSRQVKQVLPNDGLDLKAASAGPGVIAYEQFGGLYLFDLATGAPRKLEVRVAGDLPEVRPRFMKVDPRRIVSMTLSPGGARAVFSVRGEIVTAPAKKGDLRNLTNSVAVEERDPAWSPDGKTIAYLSDESGEYALHLRDQSGLGEVRKLSLGPPGFYYAPTWSPDSKKLAYTDKQLNLWFWDLGKKTPVRVDTDPWAWPTRLNPTWSPDSRWLVYTKQLPSHLHAVFAYSLEQGKSFQLTEGMSDALFARFDKNGRHLYFTASTDLGLANGVFDMSSLARPVTRGVFLMVLRKRDGSPLAPESDEERVDAGAPADTAPPRVEIDVDGIGQRTLMLPVPARNYQGLWVGKSGIVFLLENPPVDPVDPAEFTEGTQTQLVRKFDLKTRKVETILEGLTPSVTNNPDVIPAFDVSFDGEAMLYRQKDEWFIGKAEKPVMPPPDDFGPLKLAALELYVDPRAEWRHMYTQVWRAQRDFFYDPSNHGLDLAQAKKKYEPYLAGLASRAELTYLFEEMLGELTVGHLYVFGGDSLESRKVRGGLLGADYVIDGGRYRFSRVYGGASFSPSLYAPLTRPGVAVGQGEYLLAVNGRELKAADDVDAALEGTAGKQVVLKVGPKPDGTGARLVTVVPIDDESALRNFAWVEANRRRVDEATHGRVAYVYLPDTWALGYAEFNRQYFAQIGRDAAVIDERFNGGGLTADYFIDVMRRPLLSYGMLRQGEDMPSPTEGIFGPKVMLINETAGSGGDLLPWMFRRVKLGPLVGKRTWGGLVGWYTFADDLIDGGGVLAPNLAFYSPEGAWEVENHGVDPDVEVDDDPKAVRAGRDPQLDRAIELTLELLKKNPPQKPRRPPYPNYHAPRAKP